MTGDLFSVSVVRSVDFRDDTHWNYPINLYPYNTLYFVLEGDGFVRIHDKTTPLKSGHVYLIPANTLYNCWCESHIHKLYIEAYVETVPGKDVFSELDGIVERPFSADRIQALIARNTTSLKDLMWFQGELLQTISLFIDEKWQPPGKDMLRFKPILDDIARSLSSDIRLGDISQKYGWHPSALSRAFHRAFGCGLKRYANQLLMNKLKQELLTTDKLLLELAIEYRFCDAYYLSAFFKKREGVSPEQYRRANARSL